MTYHNQYEGKVNSPPKLTGTAEQMIKQFSEYVFDQLQALARQSKDEFNAIKDATGTTIISRSGGVSGGGGSTITSSVNIRQGFQTVSAAGDVTINFTSIGNVTYYPFGDILTVVDGQLQRSLAIPLIPPYSSGDTRAMTSVQFRVFESGTLYWVILTQ